MTDQSIPVPGANSWRPEPPAGRDPLAPALDQKTACDEILSLLASGVYLRDACDAVGVTRDAFLAWRLSDDALSRRYFEARASWALARLDDALEGISQASSPAVVQRWRTIIQTLQWEAERLLLAYRRPDARGDAANPDRVVLHVIRWEGDEAAPELPTIDAVPEGVGEDHS